MSPQHPQVGSPALGVSPVPGSIPQVRPGQIRPESRPEMMMRVNPVGPRPPVGQTPPGAPGTPTMPLPPQGTPLSSLPGNSPGLIKVKQNIVEPEKGKPKELVNGLVSKDTREEEASRREDARSPAYSDISDNEPASVLDGENDNKDLPDDKKPELPLGAQPYPPYGLAYYGHYPQPTPLFMPPLQPPPPSTTPGKEGESKDSKDKCDKDKNIPIPGGSEYLSKIPPQYIYAPPYIYNPAYPDPYLREAPIYKEAESKELPPGLRDGDKGPTDLSRSAPGIMSGVALSPALPKEKISIVKDKQSENHAIIKEAIELKGQLPGDKRLYEPSIAYRYAFDQRPPPQALPPQEKPGEKPAGLPKPSPPISISSPRVESTPPAGPANNKDDRGEKKPETKSEGVKPTMETTGPPPPPTSSAYYPQFPYGALAYDPYRPPIVPPMSMTTGFPHYLAAPGIVPRFPLGPAVNNAPEDLSRGGSSGAMIHPSHLYTNHKIVELQERALKSPLSPAGLGMTSPVQSTPQKVGSPLTNKEGLTSVATTSSSSSSLAHGGVMAVGGGVEGRSPPTARPPTHPHHLHESYSHYPLLPPYHYAALQAGQTPVPAAAPSGLPPAK